MGLRCRKREPGLTVISSRGMRCMKREMPNIEHTELCQFPGPEALARGAALRWLGPAAPVFRHVALSGGRIARLFLGAAAEMAMADPTVRRKLQQTHFFWADERCVSPADPESNYGLAKAGLFDRVGMPETAIHRLRGELDPWEAVQIANKEILGTVPRNAAGVPVIDLILLGMGEDGHVASLFPGQVIPATESVFAVVIGPKPPNPRLTLTYGVLAVGRETWVLVSGEGKEVTLRNSLQGKDDTPLHRLIQLRNRTVILVDRFILNATAGEEVEMISK
jgi:6-phosphogluconolactonase